MCGIGVLIAPTSTSTQQQDIAGGQDAPSKLQLAWPSVLHNIDRRGPDSSKTVQHDFQTSENSQRWSLSLTSSVLSLRGQGITAQPLSSSDGRLLLAWNGQIFDWDTALSHATSSRVRLDASENDGRILLDRIQHLLKQVEQEGSESSVQLALSIALTEVEGPYAFVLLDRKQSQLLFGRDPLGRRSLLLHQSEHTSSLAILSVGSAGLAYPDSSLQEIDCSSLWSVNLLDNPTSPQPLPRIASRFTSRLLLHELRHPDPEDDPNASPFDPAQVRADFLEVLSSSVRRRVTNIDTSQPASEAHVAILFSGGLDCTTLALLAHRYVPPEQPIDLLNVAFENVRAIEAAKLEREKRLRAKAKPVSKNYGKGTRHPDVAQRDALDSAAKISKEAAKQMEQEEQEQGGVMDDIYAVPDRLTGLSSYSELCTLAPDRTWNFVSINVPYTEYTSHRATVESLMLPTSSVMDLSIASALYFASRAQGHLHPTTASPLPSLVPYTSPARVLISGLGADELLGGYSRHRAAYYSSSSASSPLCSLVHELQLDLDRLPTRNLGRDDRILSHHAKESRYPYLDHSVLAFLTSIPVHCKMDLTSLPTQGAGGDKRLLRDLANDLGLHKASQFQKRAMQFGTRAAKIDLHSNRAKGHHKLH